MADEALPPPPAPTSEPSPVPTSTTEPNPQPLTDSYPSPPTEKECPSTQVEPEPPEKEAPPPPEEAAPPAPAEIPAEKPASAEAIVESEKPKERAFMQPAESFKEESNLMADLSESELKSLDNLRKLVEDALSNKTLIPKSDVSASTSDVKQDEHEQNSDEISIWGIPLLKDERTHVALLKFLRARDFKVNESFQMLKNTLKWRSDFGTDKLVEEDLGDDLEKVVFMHGHDREGHPVCYNVYGEFQNRDLYVKTFSTDEKREKFLRWRTQFLERSIRKLDFRPGGVNTIFQVNDLKNAPGPGKRELRQATRQALHLLQDNYPEFVAKQVYVLLGLLIMRSLLCGLYMSNCQYTPMPFD